MESEATGSSVTLDVKLNNNDNEIENEDGDKKRGVFQSAYKIRLEFAVVLIYFAVYFSNAIFQSQVLYQTCTVSYGFNSTVCDQLGTNNVTTSPNIKAVEDIVQPTASKIFMTELLVQGILPAFLCLFIGSWSDKFGRKPIMLSVSVGYLCFFLIKMVIAGISLKLNVNPWIYIVASIPLSLSGGNCALVSAIFCYIADLTTYYERPYKMCLMAGVIALGNFLGSLTSSYLYAASNACVVFAVSSIAQCSAIIYLIFVINESVKKEQLSSESKLRGFFDIRLLIDMAKTVFKRRQHFETATIWCIIIPLTLVVFDQSVISNVFILFVRIKFGWTVQTYTTFNAIQIVIDFVGAVAGIVLSRRVFHVKQTTMTLIAYACYVILTAFYAAAQTSIYLYIGIGVTFLLGVATPMGQAMLTNTVPPWDIGKVFALLTAMQAIAPLIASPLYTYVYNSTFETYPGAYNIISVSLYTVCLLLTGFVHIVEYYHPNVNKVKTY